MASVSLLEAQGFVSLAELHRDGNVVVYQGKEKESGDEVILKSRTSTAPVANNIEKEYAMLSHLSQAGGTVAPLKWFRADGFDTLVMRSSEGFASGAQFVDKQNAMSIASFFPLART